VSFLNIIFTFNSKAEDPHFADPCTLENVQCEGETVTKQIVDWEAFQFHLEDLFSGSDGKLTKDGKYVLSLRGAYKNDSFNNIKDNTGKILKTSRGDIVVFPNLRFIHIVQENFSLRNIIKDTNITEQALYGLMVLDKTEFTDEELKKISDLNPQVFESDFICDLKSDNEGVPACDRKDGFILLTNGKMYLQKGEFHVEGTLYYFPKETILKKFNKKDSSREKKTARK